MRSSAPTALGRLLSRALRLWRCTHREVIAQPRPRRAGCLRVERLSQGGITPYRLEEGASRCLGELDFLCVGYWVGCCRSILCGLCPSV